MFRMKLVLAGAALALLVGCSPEDEPRSEGGAETADARGKGRVDGRWYTSSQVTRGRDIFRENCASCHGAMAQGAPNWREPDANGYYPAPPLNGRGHTWHHPFPMLRDIVTNGGKQRMPAWGEKLSTADIEAVLAYITSLWPEETYVTWRDRVNDR
ncbi:c-type cytochrome [Arhodomonas sp. AD133]|uniref:c-type cytochrome n=1 Tax=Arhodomonas sp. AD133 TaxID=3415009 RepID=UPI003EBFF055